MIIGLVSMAPPFAASDRARGGIEVGADGFTEDKVRFVSRRPFALEPTNAQWATAHARWMTSPTRRMGSLSALVIEENVHRVRPGAGWA